MPPTHSPLDLRRLRTQRQLLSDAARPDSAADVVRRLCALQSQEWPSAQLAIHARAQELRQADVIRSREVERAIVLSWTLRGTLHLVAAEDLRWQLALCGPGAIRATKRRYEQLGLTEALRERALEEIEGILRRDGALNRAQLANALEARAVPVAGQAIHHLVRFAALRGLICFGAEVDGDLTYALLDDWLPAGRADPNGDEPLRQFARRYLAACGPATAADFKRWSGLSQAQVKAAWSAVRAECAPVTLHEGEALMLEQEAAPPEPSEPIVRLLPRYDNYLLGYESRRFLVGDAFAKRVHPGGGLIRACVIVNGEARANWKLEKRRTGVRVVVEPFAALDPAALRPLEAQVESLGRYLNAKREMRVAGG